MEPTLEVEFAQKSLLRSKSKFGKLSLKNATDKTNSSGVSSMSSFENQGNEVEEKQNFAIKRNNTSDLLATIQKKPKFSHESNFVNESGIDILQDTLDNIDLSRLIEESKNRTTKTRQDHVNELQDTLDNVRFSGLISCDENRTETTKPEYDAFAHYLANNNSQNYKKMHNKQENEDFLTSKVMEEIDTAINKENLTETLTENGNKTNKEKQIKKHDHLIDSNSKFKNAVFDKTSVFENEKVTAQYRREINEQFEQIENSIFTMGQHQPNNISEKFVETICNIDLEMVKPLNTNKKQEDADWPDETILNELSLNGSFGSLIKKTLINNASKSARQQKPPAQLNATCAKIEFFNLGPFYGLPLKVEELIRQNKGINELYDWQNECLMLPAIESRKNLIYALPTSGGKTLVAEILMIREIMCFKRNAIFILPYVSIVQEKVWALSPFGVALDFLIEEYASNKGVYPPRKRRRKNTVFIATIEKALGIINSLIETNRLEEIGLVVVDELHLIGEEGRGSTLEACLTKIMFLKADIQIVGMSATIGNLPDVSNFLKADVYTKNFRPVELTEYVKCGNEIARINWNYTNEEELLTDIKNVNYSYSKSLLKLDPDMVGGFVLEVVPRDSCLIFCPTKKNCENVASLLCKLCRPNLKEVRKLEKQQLVQALRDDSGNLCDILKVSVEYGIAYHHSGLTSDERRSIEEGFRSGIISVICCTSTLAAGVNLPAKRVILRSPFIGRDFINLSRYKQMIGRAGRTGLGEKGDSILIAQKQDLPKIKKMLLSPMNQALSGMHLAEGRGLRHLLLSCISLKIANTREQLQAVTQRTLLAVQSEKLQVDLKILTDQAIKDLFNLGALQEPSCGIKRLPVNLNLGDVSVEMDTTMETNAILKETQESGSKKKKLLIKRDTKLTVSELGFAAIKGGLQLSRAHILYKDLYEGQSCLVLQGHLHLLYLVTPYETAEQIKPNMQVYYEVFTSLEPNERQVAKVLGLGESAAVKMLANQPIRNVSERVINRFYVTLMLHDLWKEVSVYEVSKKYQTSRGIVQNLMTISATFASNVVNFCEQLDEFWAYSHLLKGMSQRLSHCCVKELLPLMELPAVKQSRAKQLHDAGYKTLQSIAKANVNELVENIEFLSRKVANQLIATSKMLLLERVENLREETEDVLDGVKVF